MYRRKLLAVGTAGLSAAIAGCTGADDDSDDENGADPDPEPADDDDADGTDDTGMDDSEEAEVEEEPEPEPEEEEEDDEAAETVEEPDPITLEGNGATVSDPIDIEGGLVVVDAEHDGDSNFQIHFVGDGDFDDMFVNEIGAYEGETADVIEDGEYLVEIEADGGWSIEIRQPRATTGDDLPVTLEGEGPTVLGPFNFEGTPVAEGSHDGSSNFQVHIYPDEYDAFAGELVFNEIGEYEGETTVSHDGTGWVAVQADGTWSIEIE